MNGSVLIQIRNLTVIDTSLFPIKYLALEGKMIGDLMVWDTDIEGEHRQIQNRW